MEAEKPAHGPTDYGKGSIGRPVDDGKWAAAWAKYCDRHGCSYNQYGLCVFCGRTRDERNKDV